MAAAASAKKDEQREIRRAVAMGLKLVKMLGGTGEVQLNVGEYTVQVAVGEGSVKIELEK